MFLKRLAAFFNNYFDIPKNDEIKIMMNKILKNRKTKVT